MKDDIITSLYEIIASSMYKSLCPDKSLNFECKFKIYFEYFKKKSKNLHFYFEKNQSNDTIT